MERLLTKRPTPSSKNHVSRNPETHARCLQPTSTARSFTHQPPPLPPILDLSSPFTSAAPPYLPSDPFVHMYSLSVTDIPSVPPPFRSTTFHPSPTTDVVVLNPFVYSIYI
uniref:Uncharacterized protein n=1 Tax=Cucumis melo TaxID=3656 RepID=A0A9I9CKI2_CUCME